MFTYIFILKIHCGDRHHTCNGKLKAKDDAAASVFLAKITHEWIDDNLEAEPIDSIETKIRRRKTFHCSGCERGFRTVEAALRHKMTCRKVKALP